MKHTNTPLSVQLKKIVVYGYLPIVATVNMADFSSRMVTMSKIRYPKAESLPVTGGEPEAKVQVAIVGERFNENLQRPLYGGRLTTKYSLWHPGIDVAIATGTIIKPITQGKVISAGWESGYGQSIVIDHGDGLTSRYAHLSKLFVKNDQSVSANQALGLVGSTGHSTGPHLHLEIYLDDKSINPLEYLPADTSVVVAK